MTRRGVWWACFGLVLVMCISLFTILRRSDNLLDDSDTSLIITEIRRQHDPWRWFHHDWPLDNHFYRPLVSESFEIELRLHPHDDYKWGLTCDFLAFITTLGLFWLLREVTDHPAVTTLSTILFIAWQISEANVRVFGYPIMSSPFTYGAPLVVLISLWMHRAALSRLRVGGRAYRLLVVRPHLPVTLALRTRVGISMRILRKFGRVLSFSLPAALLWYWLGTYEMEGFTHLSFRMLDWIPGRTASMMTAFAFIGFAAFARYMRLLPRKLPTPTARDVPSTRSSISPSDRMPSIAWPLLAVLCEALALLSYEQAVVVPAVFGLIGLLFWLRGAQGRWWLWAAPFGAVLVAYLCVRHAYIPSTRSFYYNEQKRTTESAIRALCSYLAFFYSPLSEVWFFITQSPILFAVSIGPYIFIANAIAAVNALWQMRRRWMLAGFGYLVSGVTYSPMAWFKDFEHYHYLSMAFRSLFVVMMCWIALDLTVIAFSPRGLQAPRRLVPAPGSLAHP